MLASKYPLVARLLRLPNWCYASLACVLLGVYAFALTALQPLTALPPFRAQQVWFTLNVVLLGCFFVRAPCCVSCVAETLGRCGAAARARWANAGLPVAWAAWHHRGAAACSHRHLAASRGVRSAVLCARLPAENLPGPAWPAVSTPTALAAAVVDGQRSTCACGAQHGWLRFCALPAAGWSSV